MGEESPKPAKTATGAVFLSYASQDAEAAQRICDALRTAGIEVWFDQSELRGGDTWDHKIRQQIRDCTLFLPIISQSTQARAEGYFRLEWRLADQRTHLMGRSRAFLVPVCIDATREIVYLPDRPARNRLVTSDPGVAPRILNVLGGTLAGGGSLLLGCGLFYAKRKHRKNRP